MPNEDLPADWSDPSLPYPSFQKFEGVLREDVRIRHLLRDDEFAQQFCDVCAAYDLVEIVSGETVGGGTDDFWHMVAHYRNRGESHLVFIGGNVRYPMRPSVAAEVEDELRRVGYRIDRTRFLAEQRPT